MITARVRKIFLVGLIFLGCFCLNVSIIKAAGSCTAIISPTTMQTNTTSDFTFSITNTGSGSILYFKITSPSQNFLIQGTSLNGWEKESSSQSVTFYGGNILSGSTVEIPISILSGENETSNENWTVEVNEILSSSGTSNCSGSLTTSISGIRDITAPNITGNITLSNITASSVTISWTTDEASDSVVNYGLDENYGLTKNSSDLTTTHSIVLTGLTANIKYYFEVSSADASGNRTTNSQNEFYTAASGVGTGTTITVTVDRTTTVTSTVTTTVTRTVAPLTDKVAPTIKINTNFSKAFFEPPTISGRVTDSGDINVGVVSIEYSLDGGKNWIPVDIIDNIGKKTTDFEFTPQGLDDGNYLVKLRAKDFSNNWGASKTYTMIIDRLPPQVGGVLFALGPMILQPDINGYIYTIAGLGIKTIFSAVGGALNIDLSYDDQKFLMIKNEENGLWSTFLNISKAGNFGLKAKSIDGAKNETERNLNTVVVLPSGKIEDENKNPIEKAKIKIYLLEKNSNSFVLWDALPYLQNNPLESDKNGEYRLMLPAGKYFMEITAKGKRKIRTEIFEIEKATPINQDFNLEKFKFWYWWPKTVPINMINNKVVNDYRSEKIGKMIPDFDLTNGDNQFSSTSILGKPTIITFVSSWEPQTSDQLEILDQFKNENTGVNVVAVMVQETVSKTNIFKKIGGYKIPIIADADGVLVKPLDLKSLPVTIFLDRKGIIKYMNVGLVNKTTLLEGVLN